MVKILPKWVRELHLGKGSVVMKGGMNVAPMTDAVLTVLRRDKISYNQIKQVLPVLAAYFEEEHSLPDDQRVCNLCGLGPGDLGKEVFWGKSPCSVPFGTRMVDETPACYGSDHYRWQSFQALLEALLIHSYMQVRKAERECLLVNMDLLCVLLMQQ